MAWYTKEIKKKYRVRTEVDERTNDFIREPIVGNEKKGKYSENDVYIECSSGMVYPISSKIFEAWVGDRKNGTNKIQTYKKIMKENRKIILKENRICGDGEGTFQFEKQYLDNIVKAMSGTYRNGLGRSPFDKENLVIEKYEIPEEDIEQYGKVRKGIEERRGKKVTLAEFSKVYKEFANREYGYSTTAYNKRCKLEVVTGRELFHKTGKWEIFLEYLENEL